MWTPLSLTPPASVVALADELAGTLGAVRAAWAAGLSGLGLSSLTTPSPPGATALMAQTCAYLAVTPYQQGVGQRRGDRGYLSPLATVRAVADRLAAAGAALSGTSLVLLLLAAPDEAGLAETLSTWNAVYPVLELQQAERRARTLAGLERTKFVIPTAPAWPTWRAAAPRRDATGLKIAVALGGQAATIDGAAVAEMPPGSILVNFAARRQDAIQARLDALDAIQGRLSGNAPWWYGTTLEGTPGDMARTLEQSAPPLNDAYKCSVAVCWCGTQQQTTYYKETFGL